MSILNERIKKCREALGMSQAELAELLGYSDRSTIAKIEKGTNDITQSKIEAFAKALHTTPAYLMGWENNFGEADDDTRNLLKAQQALTKAIEQSSDLPSKERINLLFDMSDYDPMVVAFNLDFDQDYLTRWMVYGDIPPAPIVNKILGVFQIKPKDLFDAKDLGAYEDEQKEWPSLVDGDLIWDDEYAIFGGEKRNARTIPEGLEAMLNRLGQCLIGLNDEGRQKVEDYAKDLAQMPKYQREQPRQTPPSTLESNDLLPPPRRTRNGPTP